MYIHFIIFCTCEEFYQITLLIVFDFHSDFSSHAKRCLLPTSAVASTMEKRRRVQNVCTFVELGAPEVLGLAFTGASLVGSFSFLSASRLLQTGFHQGPPKFADQLHFVHISE